MSGTRDIPTHLSLYLVERLGDVRTPGSSEQQVSNQASPTTAWTVGDLGAFYTAHRSDIHAHAARLLRDSNRADEVVQDVFLKFVLAAPEIGSHEHALSYLHRSVENQCKDIFRLEGRRPNLVALDDSSAELEASWYTTDPDVADQMEAADDAAIVRQALAMLPAAQRQALLMWEVEDAETKEIAAALGIEEKNVRHTVSRARANFRKILTLWVIDEERGLTALDLLSSTYKKAAANAKNAGKIALGLVILISAFLGFNSLTAHDLTPAKTVAIAPHSSTPAVPAKEPIKKNDGMGNGAILPHATPAPKASAASTTTLAAAPTISVVSAQRAFNKAVINVNVALAKLAPAIWPGLDANGVPVGYTVNDGSAISGTAVINQEFPVLTLDATVVTQSQLMTYTDSTNVLLDQKVTFNGIKVSAYDVDPSVRINGAWVTLHIAAQNTKFETLSDGSTLITKWLLIDTTDKSGSTMKMPGYGVDATHPPAVITIRLHTSQSGQPIYGEAVQVLDPLKGSA